jgi:glycosyltransferase involved in cell wall biosynthesis
MKLLILAEQFPFTPDGDFRGGVEARTYFAALALSSEHEVTVLSTNERSRTQSPLQGIEVLRVGPARSSVGKAGFLKRTQFFLAALKTASRLSFDAVEGTNHLTYELAIRLAKQKKIPAYATYHDLWIGEWPRQFGWLRGLFGNWSEKRTLRYPWKKILAVSTVTRAKLIQHGVPADRIAVVPNGVPTDHLPAKTERADRPSLVYVGRLVSYKRVDDLITAVAALRESIPTILLHIVGTGPERTALDARVHRLGLEENVVFHGFVPRLMDVLELVAQCHALCLPSTLEGFGLVTIEAMAVGTPYVATDIPPTVEVTQNGIGGILYPPGSIDDLTSGLRAIVSDRSYGDQLGLAGKAFVLKEYDWQRIGEHLRSVYRAN